MDNVKRFVTTCVKSDGPTIIAMVEAAIDIKRRTFLRHVCKSELADIAKELGYCRHGSQGLTMAHDWHITYHRSKYKGRRCYYFCWSGIEYVFA